MSEIDLLGIGKLATAAKEPILKLMELCECAIGKIYEPTHVVRMAKARAEEIKLISSASKENIDLPVLYSKGDVEVDTRSGQELAIRTQNRLQYQEQQKQQNIEMIISHAYETLEAEETISKEPVDKDWATRLFNIAGEVSDEDIQLLWGKVLSGEIKKPGSYSLRTLETLRNLSKAEAEVFRKIANYVLNTSNTHFVYGDLKTLEIEDIAFSDFLILDEAGLIMQNELSLPLSYAENNETRFIIYGDFIVFIKRTSKEMTEVRIPCFVLTKAGVEVFSIIDKCFKDSYIKNIATKLKEQNVTVSYNKIIRVNVDDSIEYDRTSVTF
jgi:hypothetical protein